jgi:hypothetical protein
MNLLGSQHSEMINQNQKGMQTWSKAGRVDGGELVKSAQGNLLYIKEI